MPFLQTPEWCGSHGNLQAFGMLLDKNSIFSYIPDYWTVPDERPKLRHELKRVPENALTGKVSEAERFKHVPPLGSKEIFIGFTSEETAKYEIDRAEKIILEHVDQLEMNNDVLTSDNIGNALRQALVDRNGDVRYRRENCSIPFQCEIILTECFSAKGFMRADMRAPSLLHTVTEQLAEDWIECLKIVGNTQRYYYGTQLIIDEERGIVWPDDKSMTRVVSYVVNDFQYSRHFDKDLHDFHGKLREKPLQSYSKTILENYFRNSTCTFWSGNLREDAPCAGMLRPEHYSRPMSTMRLWIDSYSDMVSTVAEAVSSMKEDDCESWSNEDHTNVDLFNIFKRDFSSESYEIRWIFKQFEKAINYKVDEDDRAMDIVLLQTHLIASMFDACRYREFKETLFKNIVTNSLVVNKLNRLGAHRAHVIELPRDGYTGFWVEAWGEELLSTIERHANEAMEKGSSGIQLLNPTRTVPHAGRSFTTCKSLRKNEEIICDEISIRHGQATTMALGTAKNYRSLTVVNGDSEGTLFHLTLKKKGVVAYKATSKASLRLKMAGGAVSHVSPVQIASLFKVDPSKWFCSECCASEPFNLALSGDCCKGDSVWALTSILSNMVKVSNMSTVRYIPERLVTDSVDGLVITANLDAELVSKLPMAVARFGNTPSQGQSSTNTPSSGSDSSTSADTHVFTQLQSEHEIYQVISYDEILDLEPLSPPQQLNLQLKDAPLGVLKYRKKIGGIRDVSTTSEATAST